jgi:hypothetical protein
MPDDHNLAPPSAPTSVGAARLEEVRQAGLSSHWPPSHAPIRWRPRCGGPAALSAHRIRLSIDLDARHSDAT